MNRQQMANVQFRKEIDELREQYNMLLTIQTSATKVAERACEVSQAQARNLQSLTEIIDNQEERIQLLEAKINATAN